MVSQGEGFNWWQNWSNAVFVLNSDISESCTLDALETVSYKSMRYKPGRSLLWQLWQSKLADIHNLF